MSDNIPFEIQVEILKRLPIKSLIQFRSVSKPWKSLIDSSEFMADFNLNHTEPHHLFVSYDNNNNEQKYVSILDDDSFPQHKVSLTLPISFNNNQLYCSRIIGSSKGLFCFYIYDHNININRFPITETAVIWNPSIRKSVFISVPNVLPCPYETVFGFAVCPLTNHPKLVKFIWKQKLMSIYPQNRELDNIVMPPRVEICTFKSRVWVWRSISTNLPRESIALTMEHVAIGRFIYWLGYDRNNEYDGIENQYNLILLFDITNEEFTEEIDLPDGLQGGYNINMRMSKLRDSVIVMETDIRVDDQEYDVWMMENGVAKSFRKLYTIAKPDASIVSILGFRNTGEPIVYMMPRYDKQNGLFVYDSVTQQLSYIGISGKGLSYFASSYVESLLLLDH